MKREREPTAIFRPRFKVAGIGAQIGEKRGRQDGGRKGEKYSVFTPSEVTIHIISNTEKCNALEGVKGP